MTVWHTGRSWGGPGDIERDCLCPKAPCGLVANNSAAPDCDQHDGSRTIRSSHRADHCPANPTNPAGPTPDQPAEETA